MGNGISPKQLLLWTNLITWCRPNTSGIFVYLKLLRVVQDMSKKCRRNPKALCCSAAICSKSVKQSSGTFSSRITWYFLLAQGKLLVTCIFVLKTRICWTSCGQDLCEGKHWNGNSGRQEGNIKAEISPLSLSLLNPHSCLRQILWYSK